MAFEFDNEIDFLLRQVARSNDSARPNTDTAEEEVAHLDADDLAAFAENAIPPSARFAFASHLADCDSCREVLSNLILLNEIAVADEAVIAAEPEKTVVPAKLSWLDSFKNFFALPTLGYAMAALALLLVGSFAFVALRVNQEIRPASVAQIEPEQTEETQAKKRSSAPQPVEQKDENEASAVPEPSPTIENSNTTITELSPSPSETPADLPPSVRMTRGENSVNRNAAPSETSVARNNSANLNLAANTAASPLAQQPNASSVAGGAARQTPSDSNTSLSAAPKPASKAKEESLERARSNSDKDESAKADDNIDMAQAAPPAPERRAAATAGAEISREKKIAVETHVVGGRTFQKLGGVWKDTSYNSQNMINISRGSDDYKKLDAGLRSIAEALSGEIIVVWQSKAYRIR